MVSARVMLVGFIAVCFAIKRITGEPFQVPSYNIDLDLPPDQRWLNVTQKYAKYAAQIVADIRSKISPLIIPLAEKLALYLHDHFPAPYPGELASVSHGLNISLADAILLNIFYDLSAFCTSIVAQDTKGNIFHGRNLDYGIFKILRNISFISNFQSKGKTVYTGVTFAGQVGLLTAQRPNAITVSLDERDRCCLWLNIFEAIFNKKAMPITFLIRDVVSSKEIEFDHAVKMLSQVPLMAAGYLIVGGTTVGQGAVITRNRENAVDIWYLSKDASKSPWFLVETNYDHWTTPPPSDDRRHPAEKALTKVTQQKLTAETLFNVLSVHPVLNNRTVYTTIMQAKNPDLFNTWIRWP